MEESSGSDKFAKSESWKIFDAISPNYDRLNRILSAGQDMRWRRAMIRFLPQEKGILVLDLATGTADVLLSICKMRKDIGQGLGLDLSDKMLNLGLRKVAAQGLTGKILLRNGDAQDIPNPDATFSAVTMAFGIRNVPDPLKALKEMHRVLKKGGRAIILEFSLPANPLVRWLDLLYLRHLLPLVGFAFSGNYQAYKYLNETIEVFPCGKKFLDLMRQAGFGRLEAHPLFFGAATIYVGEK